MPESAPHRCRRCGQLVRGICACYTPFRDRPPSWNRGGKKGWDAFRRRWLAAHPWCMDCGAPAVRVCHKPGTDYLRDRCNPAAIEGQRCEPCDLIVTARQGSQSR